MKSGATLSSPPVADPTFGIQQFTVGTGGEGHHGLVTPLPTSQVTDDVTFGILKLTLHANSYDWVFLPIAGSTFTDSGTHAVHGPPADTVPPTVTISSIVPATIGAAGTANVTWHASENGSYSVRVGGTNCSTGTQVSGGSYTTAPANVVTAISGSALVEGPNTLRVCVTDAGTNTGSASTTVSRDSVAPTVTVVSANPSTLTPSAPSTDITWHASENGTYNVRVGGADCSTGAQVTGGTYSTAPTNVVTNVLASALTNGPNTIRVCVTDLGSNVGSDSIVVTKSATGIAPTTPVLDNFNRANGGAGANWSLIRPSGFAALNISGNAAVDSSATASFTWDYWNQATFGPELRRT